MADPTTAYHFGDLTRGFVAWFGPHAKAVYGKVDWLKFAKALLLGFVATGTLSYTAAFTALFSSITDPDWATKGPAVVGAIISCVELIRRIFQGRKPGETTTIDVTPASTTSCSVVSELDNGPQVVDIDSGQHDVFGL